MPPGLIPRFPINNCPVCKSICGAPKLKNRSWTGRSKWVRLECACGVSGTWRETIDPAMSWYNAARGWELIAGRFETDHAPSEE